MKKILLLLLSICIVAISCKSQHKTGYGSPLVVLTETNPWLMVVGSDSPTIAIYENGQVIYKKMTDDKAEYYEVNLSHEDLLQTINNLGINDCLKKLPKHIDVSIATDQPTAKLFLNLDSVKIISVYGQLRWAPDRDKAPACFINVFNNLIKYQHGGAKEWLPDSIEVMLTNYSHSPEKPLAWPVAWPDLKNKTTIKRGDDLYSVYLDKKYFPAFIKLNSSLKENQAVLVNGQKLSVSYRIPFPNLK
ncbi:hypothetical protein ACFGVS_29200 [Mucilaginibacter sp. AW1-7]|uniref:hypothetical protein n=1 Tax=unclassified Mucilaginibacter TaxID=2617802 RepID=UPI0023656687|nr:hypothetical protein [Mucilaginibacter sp. KACC 22773]WDF75953.1 hypothetical protein PQ469_18855 [Mucilaginibacter sp. KACC 22773]